MNCSCGKPATALAVFVLDDEGRTDYLPICTSESLHVGDELDGQTISEIVPWHAGPGYIADREERLAVRPDWLR